MDSGATKRPLGTVLCRDCYNFRGMRTGPERRRPGPRLCAAGIEVHDIDIFGCESYGPLTLVARTPGRDGSASRGGSAS